MPRRRNAAFSLLEVLFAVALFGAVVTFILSAQAGLVAGNRRAANMSQALEIGRCRMSELEEKELKLGFPEIEEKDTSSMCCEDKEVPGFTCDWQIERVTLPEVTTLGGDAGMGSSLFGGLGLDLDGGVPGLGGSGLGGAPGLPGSLATPGASLFNPMGGAGIDFDAGFAGMGSMLTQTMTGGAGAQGLLSMVFSIVYPSLKPLLEAAIRRVTVVIHWKEGIAVRDFTLTQYLTNPSRAGLAASMADAGVFSADGGLATPVSTATVGAPATGGLPGMGGLPGVGH